MGLITDTINDGRDDAGQSATYKTRFSANGWNLVEILTDFGDVNTSNGFIKPHFQGAQIGPFIDGGFNTDALQFRASSNQLMQFASLFPGLDSFTAGNEYTIRFAEHIIDDTPARIVVGNASTWGACTQKLYLFPTAWADTSVSAPWRAIPWASTGQTVWAYVVNDSGVVSAASPKTVP